MADEQNQQTTENKEEDISNTQEFSQEIHDEIDTEIKNQIKLDGIKCFEATYKEVVEENEKLKNDVKKLLELTRIYEEHIRKFETEIRDLKTKMSQKHPILEIGQPFSFNNRQNKFIYDTPKILQVPGYDVKIIKAKELKSGQLVGFNRENKFIYGFGYLNGNNILFFDQDTNNSILKSTLVVSFDIFSKKSKGYLTTEDYIVLEPKVIEKCSSELASYSKVLLEEAINDIATDLCFMDMEVSKKLKHTLQT
ncbi:hypothetical protein DICPUDRAFT_160040 [Dictyostelium purpureum]|uniref:Uncharacterized protein n=1 Tax=Dictyostelium purpureum TaxID=5786 RepID=F1A5K3_DICPU|nr:uncharacterized protein DICPUDRAFT_160040 [Dictyostelium purpureum]EGC28526.1 hypothetical protein DICPUDRAFT_160040 [Dictyostelium purpureum]|eukprot:XP_003294947.1 hypothetical protein DICPUDRAFT_160040 [Dictyostelium purpureum]